MFLGEKGIVILLLFIYYYVRRTCVFTCGVYVSGKRVSVLDNLCTEPGQEREAVCMR